MAERLVISDRALMQAVRTYIRGELDGVPGDKGHAGLYRMAGLGIPKDWGNYQHLVGQVKALETVLHVMEEKAKELGVLEEQVFFHPGMH